MTDEGTPRQQAWGKTDKAKRPAHHLAHHSMDVTSVLEGLIRHPVLSRRLDAAAGRSLTDGDRIWLASFAFLHDVGKLSPAFQAKAWPADRSQRRSHLEEGAAWLNSAQGRLGELGAGLSRLLMILAQAGEQAFSEWFGALFAHHGRPVSLSVRRIFAQRPDYDWRAEEATMDEALRRWFPNAAPAPELFKSRELVHLFAGLLALADWIGSDETVFRFERHLDLEGYADRSRQRGAEALRAIGLSDPVWPATEPEFVALTSFAEPRGAQALVRDLPPDARLVILEAETGSGKTEAALWHFSRLRSAGLVDALYFALPTRAAAGQIFERMKEAMGRVDGPEPILAVPGQLRAGKATGRRLPGFEVLWDDGRRRWAAEHATRYLAAPVAVGTVDQVLMAGLTVKHAHMRGAALSRSLLVIDEVHASDAYMNVVAQRLVRDHLALGGYALLMSATLGSAARATWLGQAAPSREVAEAVPYPAVWRVGVDVPLTPMDRSREKVVEPHLVPTMDTERAAEEALEAAARGARVLVIRNTVSAAVATWRAVVTARPDLCLQAGGGPALHHSRFAAEDRRLLDEAVEAGFGKASAGGGTIAVGTQTLEQSLDIDADLLISDLCPMDVLLQRIGRLHRHEARARPAGFAEAQVLVLAPEGGLDRLAAGPSFENGLGAWERSGVIAGVYVDLCGVEATWRLVAEGGRWSIPTDNRRLVEGATHEDALREIEREMGWETYRMRVIAKGLAEERHGGLLALDRSQPFPASFPDADEVVQTRLGARGPVLKLDERPIGPFGQRITRIAPPAWWCRGLTGEETVRMEDAGDVLRILVGDRVFGYSQEGLSRQAQ